FPSANYMHQWWTASLSIAPFVYCIHRLVEHAAARRWWNGRLSRRESLATVAVLAAVAAPGIVERWQFTTERMRTLTETLEAPSVLKGVRTDKETLTIFGALYEAISNYKQHHPAARIVSQDHCDGYTSGCVPESLLWLSFIDDNPHGQAVYWPIPVLTKGIYPDYEPRFLSDLERTKPLVVDTIRGPFRPENTISGYTLLVGVSREYSSWYVFAPEHSTASEHGEVQVRLGPPPAVVNAEGKNVLEGADREGVRAAADAQEQVPPDDAQEPVPPDAQGPVPPPPPRMYAWPADADVPRHIGP